MRNFRASSILVLVFLITGCTGNATGPFQDIEGPALEVNRSEYEAVYLSGEGAYSRYQFEIVAQYTNRTRKALYLSSCLPDDPHPMHTVEGIGFGSAYAMVFGCVGHINHFRMTPGETRVDTLLIAGPNIFSEGEPHGLLAGEFRLRYFARLDQEDTQSELPDSLTVSALFLVSVER